VCGVEEKKRKKKCAGIFPKFKLGFLSLFSEGEKGGKGKNNRKITAVIRKRRYNREEIYIFLLGTRKRRVASGLLEIQRRRKGKRGANLPSKNRDKKTSGQSLPAREEKETIEKGGERRSPGSLPRCGRGGGGLENGKKKKRRTNLLPQRAKKGGRWSACKGKKEGRKD